MNELEQQSKLPEWIVVFETYSLQEAHIVAGRLKAYGIEAIVHTIPGASAIGITYGKLGEKSILVRLNNYEDAMAILNPDEAENLPESTEKIQYLWDDETEE